MKSQNSKPVSEKRTDAGRKKSAEKTKKMKKDLPELSDASGKEKFEGTLRYKEGEKDK